MGTHSPLYKDGVTSLLIVHCVETIPFVAAGASRGNISRMPSMDYLINFPTLGALPCA